MSSCSCRSRGQFGRFQTADTVYLHTGEAHLKEEKVKRLLLESSTVNKS